MIILLFYFLLIVFASFLEVWDFVIVFWVCPSSHNLFYLLLLTHVYFLLLCLFSTASPVTYIMLYFHQFFFYIISFISSSFRIFGDIFCLHLSWISPFFNLPLLFLLVLVATITLELLTFLKVFSSHCAYRDPSDYPFSHSSSSSFISPAYHHMMEIDLSRLQYFVNPSAICGFICCSILLGVFFLCLWVWYRFPQQGLLLLFAASSSCVLSSSLFNS